MLTSILTEDKLLDSFKSIKFVFNNSIIEYNRIKISNKGIIYNGRKFMIPSFNKKRNDYQLKIKFTEEEIVKYGKKETSIYIKEALYMCFIDNTFIPNKNSKFLIKNNDVDNTYIGFISDNLELQIQDKDIKQDLRVIQDCHKITNDKEFKPIFIEIDNINVKTNYFISKTGLIWDQIKNKYKIPSIKLLTDGSNDYFTTINFKNERPQVRIKNILYTSFIDNTFNSNNDKTINIKKNRSGNIYIDFKLEDLILSSPSDHNKAQERFTNRQVNEYDMNYNLINKWKNLLELTNSLRERFDALPENEMDLRKYIRKCCNHKQDFYLKVMATFRYDDDDEIKNPNIKIKSKLKEIERKLEESTIVDEEWKIINYIQDNKKNKINWTPAQYNVYYNKFSISNYGRLKNNQTNIIQNSYLSKDGYIMATISMYKSGIPNIKERVNRLVANAFIPIPDTYLQYNRKDLVVDHINFNRYNNYIGNLRWFTKSENNQRLKKYQQLKEQLEEIN